MARKRLTIGEKLKILTEVDKLVEDGHSLRSAAATVGIQPVQVRKWRQQRRDFEAMPRKKKSVGRGMESSIKHLEDPLIGWVLDQRAEGIPVTYKLLQVKAAQLDEDFAAKSDRAQYHVIRKLCIANEVVLRCVTNKSQRRPQEVIDDALAFLRVERQILLAPGINMDVVINMDQTPVFLSMHPSRTLNLSGQRTIHGRKTSNSTSRITASLAISASGKKLKPMLIFKGQPDGHIATRELPMLSVREDMVMVCQPSAWQDNENMAKWIDLCLVPYLQEYGQGANPILYLDAFSAHQSNVTKAKLEGLGVQLRHIPAGCTCLVQPLDVGIGKPFKD